MIQILRVSKFFFVVFALAPLFAKFNFGGGLYLHPADIFAVLLSGYLMLSHRGNFVRYYISFSAQKVLAAFFIVMVMVTLLSQLYYMSSEFAGYIKIFKLIIYLPVVYLSYRFFSQSQKEESCRFIVKICIAAMIINLTLTIVNIRIYGAGIWYVEAISSGLSNKFYVLSYPFFESTLAGAHGIWMIYLASVLIFLAHSGRGNYLLFYIFMALLSANILLSVSREGLLILLLTFFGFLVDSFKRRDGLKVLVPLLLLVFIAIAASIKYQISFSIIEKIEYTIEAFKGGGEANISNRLNVWRAYFLGISSGDLMDVLYNTLFSSGYNLSNFELILRQGGGVLPLVMLPESLILLSHAYSGFLGLLCVLLYFWLIVVMAVRSRSYTALGYIFGLVVINIFFGASMLSDTAYIYTLIVLGYLQFLAREEVDNGMASELP